MVSFQQEYAEYLKIIEAALPASIPEQPLEKGGLVVEAARYSLLSGGKRIRPVLLLGVSGMLGCEMPFALPFACALEMIHTYSLIHDDLPCMDDDDLRRGRPTCHKVYGEAIAVLAGDTLLNRAYEILLAAISPDHPGTLLAARQIADAAGSQGMIGGQALDLAAEGKLVSAVELRRLHQMKTGALIKAPVLAAANLAMISNSTGSMLDDFAQSIGLAFQIQDDILDVVSNPQELGKTTGKDQRDQKSTYVSLFGIDEAKWQLENTIGSACQALDALKAAGFNTRFLCGLTDFLLTRSS